MYRRVNRRRTKRPRPMRRRMQRYRRRGRQLQLRRIPRMTSFPTGCFVKMSIGTLDTINLAANTGYNVPYRTNINWTASANIQPAEFDRYRQLYEAFRVHALVSTWQIAATGTGIANVTMYNQMGSATLAVGLQQWQYPWAKSRILSLDKPVIMKHILKNRTTHGLTRVQYNGDDGFQGLIGSGPLYPVTAPSKISSAYCSIFNGSTHAMTVGINFKGWLLVQFTRPRPQVDDQIA